MVRTAAIMVFGGATAEANISVAHIQQSQKPIGWILTPQCNLMDADCSHALDNPAKARLFHSGISRLRNLNA